MAELELTQTGTRGSGRYPAYHALWHLFTIGVMQKGAGFQSAAWQKVEDLQAEETGWRPTRIAVIDTSVAADHPNLAPAVLKELSIDLFSSDKGSFPTPAQNTVPAELTDVRGKAPLAGVQKILDDFVAGLVGRYAEGRAASPGPRMVYPAARSSFSAHGTAMAGLIGAQPRGAGEIALVGPDLLPLPGDAAGKPVLPVGAVGFAYAGVDPYCRIVPIATHFDPEPRQMILALLYAWLVKADVIVLAREISSPLATVPEIPGEKGIDLLTRLSARLGIGLSRDELEEWRLLDKLLVELSMTIPIVCAAGNSAEGTLAYPAALARSRNGIIAVGAHTSTGAPSAFTSGGAGKHAAPTVFAPSGDGERLDRVLQRIDTDSPGYHSADEGSGYLGQLGTVPSGTGPLESLFSSLDIVSTDVPGRAGYNSSVFTGLVSEKDAVLDYRSYYCRFSGTSAATAITAGLLSLGISAGLVARGDGVAAKKRLRGTAPADPLAAEPKLDWSRLAL